MRRSQTMVKEALALLAAAALLGSLLWWASQRGASDSLEPAAAPAAKPAPAPAFARSLEGTRTDGALAVAADDVLVADEELVELFDYYLAAVGEKTPEQVRAQIERELERRLRPPASGAAKALLGRYLDYKRALAALEQRKDLAGADVTAIRKRLLAMRTLRARYFSTQETRAMFGREDGEQQDALARLEVRQDRTLDEAQKRERLAALDAALSPEVREARAAPLRVAQLEEAVERLRAQGAGDEAVFQARAAAFDPEAARRLAEVDREEADWKRRIGAYLDARRTQKDAGTLAALRGRLFSEEEQRRLPAYEEGMP
ncbi:lipase secretion chaperone [Massilia sp. ST3]|uniref:lipase secretion chaperone n=1 Tax=Massilia sp. ST3 TaxID=2824903 RepID=UPI001B82F199|nr:lipase secretion chaperone [Massilia sp. ST3]MBQ5949436.1 lipase chaperone [Massilia sp. ST3]